MTNTINSNNTVATLGSPPPVYSIPFPLEYDKELKCNDRNWTYWLTKKDDTVKIKVYYQDTECYGPRNVLISQLNHTHFVSYNANGINQLFTIRLSERALIQLLEEEEEEKKNSPPPPYEPPSSTQNKNDFTFSSNSNQNISIVNEVRYVDGKETSRKTWDSRVTHDTTNPINPDELDTDSVSNFSQNNSHTKTQKDEDSISVGIESNKMSNQSMPTEKCVIQ